MAIPDFQSLMLPVLKQFADGTERHPADIRGTLATQFVLTPAELEQLLPSGRQTAFGNRIAWALGYLKQAIILESPRRGIYVITQRGRDVLKESPARIDIHYLKKFPEFVSFRTPAVLHELKSTDPGLSKIMTDGLPAAVDGLSLTPDEHVHIGAARIKENLVVQLLERVKRSTPAAFESLVVDVLVAMGYGGSHEDAAQVVGKSGDGGIDGIIKEDRLGLESIYVQAKRWESTVGRPVIQQFVGALQERKARKGVVITTSSFSREAIDSAKSQQTTIVLIDGAQLADFMIEFGVGVSDVETIKIKRLDEDYFAEE